jgi:hypothetical protein
MRYPGIDNLADLERAELQALWQRLFKREAPAKMHRETLLAFLAYRLQERQEGALSKAAQIQLRRAAETLGQGKSYHPEGAQPYKPGTRILRRWGGELREVTVLERGYAYRGEVYRSLSQIAREITGVRWNGPAFFGLRKGRG